MSKKITTEEFITKAEAVHGKRYDYSEVEYVKARTKVKILCKIHKEFWQRPSEHTFGNGQGCPDCGGTAKSTTKEFIIKARAVHGNRYDYSLVEYVNADTKVKILCETHGEFEQTPHSHTAGKGKGCPNCGGNVKSTTEEFIIKACAVHGNRYDYSKTKYVNSKTKVKIFCEIHGEFEQRPDYHLADGGCKSCSDVAQTSTTEAFIIKAEAVHGKRYDYSKTKYVNADTKVKIICETHGEFEQVANNHLQGNGCEKCGKIAQASTTEEFITKAHAVHGERYDYSKAEYVKSGTKVKIICKTHRVFEQSPSNHLTGKGCPDCADYGFNPDKPAILYYLRVDSRKGLFYKIGITNRTVEERFSPDDLSLVTVINTESYEQGGDAQKEEQRILKQFTEFRAKDVDILANGNTELFTKDVLGLDLHLNGKGILECSPQAGG